MVAVAKELRTPEELTKTHQRFGSPWFLLGGEVGGAGLDGYERTAGYVIDAAGIVRQVMPMETYNRPRWTAVLAEIDRVLGAR